MGKTVNFVRDHFSRFMKMVHRGNTQSATKILERVKSIASSTLIAKG